MANERQLALAGLIVESRRVSGSAELGGYLGSFPTEAVFERQKMRLLERSVSEESWVFMQGEKFVVHRSVYRGGVDTLLMATQPRIYSTDYVLDVGCGSGIVSVFAANRARRVMAVDINPLAVACCEWNLHNQGVANALACVSDLFEQVPGQFDVVLFNPPYVDTPSAQGHERMFWDAGGDTKRRFFQFVRRYMRPGGRVYLGWASLAETNPETPGSLAALAGLSPTRVWSSGIPGSATFHLIEMQTVQSNRDGHSG